MNGSVTGFDLLLIDEDRIMFQTPVVAGERYAFMGSFRRGTKCGVDLAVTGIDGYLAKFREGKFVASRRASFSTVRGC